MSIGGVALKHFSALPQTNINSTKPPHQCHAVFHSFLSDDSKHDADTTTTHSKYFISFLKEKK